MSTHFCRVGNTKPNLNKSFRLRAIKDKTAELVVDIQKKKIIKSFDVTP